MQHILKRYPALLLFSANQILFTAPGQTFLISLFIPYIFSDLNISLSMFAGLYSTATISASLLLNFFGRKFDKYNPKLNLISLLIAMAGACFLLSVTTNLVMLLVSFFLLRLIGQGLLGLFGSTIITKAF